MSHHSHGHVVRRTSFLGVMAALSLLPSSRADAQQDPGAAAVIAPGTRVRVRVEAPRNAAAAGSPQASRHLTGDLLRLDADSIVVRAGGESVAASRMHVQDIAVTRGRRSLGSAAWRGAYIGAGVGAVVGAVDGYTSYEPCGPADILCPSRGGSVALGAIAGGVAGSLVGAVVGMVARRERWEKVPLSPDLRVGLTLTPRGTGLAVRF